MADYNESFLPHEYYHIIDPDNRMTLSECTQKEKEIIDGMPKDFPQALIYVMNISGITIEKLAENAHTSRSTIIRYRTGKKGISSPENLVTLCVGMHIPPWLSWELVDRTIFTIRGSHQQRAYRMILNSMYMKPLDEIQRFLSTAGYERIHVAAE